MTGFLLFSPDSVLIRLTKITGERAILVELAQKFYIQLSSQVINVSNLENKHLIQLRKSKDYLLLSLSFYSIEEMKGS